MKGDLSQSWSKFMAQSFPRYRGVGMEVVPGGWKYRGAIYATQYELDKAIDEDHKVFGNSLNRLKNIK
jgi:hypothetical protein